MSNKMTSMMPGICKKRYDNRKALGSRLRSLSCVGSARESGRKFSTFCEDEIADRTTF